MKRTTFLRAASALPIVTPLATAPLIWIGADPFGVLAILAGAAAFAGVPYAIVVVVALWFLRDSTPSSFWWLAWRAPPIFAVVFGSSLLPYLLVEEPPPRLDVSLMLAPFFYGPYILPIGYFYVLLAWMAYRSAERRGCFQETG